jgi:hypothetical protein
MDRLYATESREVAANEGSATASLVESGKMEHTLLVEATKIVNKYGGLRYFSLGREGRVALEPGPAICQGWYHILASLVNGEAW